MPEVGIYDSPEVNAFATGPSKRSSLVAVSSGLMRSMRREEIEGVLAHEVSHIQNGDMVTMTLIQGVVNAFSIFFSRVIANIVRQLVDERISGLVFFVTTIVFDIVFSMLGMIVVAWFSRAREFRADAGAAVLSSRDNMIAALQRLAGEPGAGRSLAAAAGDDEDQRRQGDRPAAADDDAPAARRAHRRPAEARRFAKKVPGTFTIHEAGSAGPIMPWSPKPSKPKGT